MNDTLPPSRPFWHDSTEPTSGPSAAERADPDWIGPYQVLGRLGEGSMGVVFRCRDLSLQRDVAVKVLRRRFESDDRYRRRFRREAKAAASLSHDCVVRIFGIHEGHGSDPSYLVMELVAGDSADRLIEERGRIAAGESVTWIRDAAIGLREASKRGLIHRDVKPSNLLVTPSDHVKIVDFGLAKDVEASPSLTEEGMVLGTPHYISPEQGQGKKVDQRSDIYSLGATLYHLLTGETPFDGESSVSVIVAHVNTSPRPPHLVVDDISLSLSRVVLRMLAKSPGDRYPSYDELIEDLEAILGGEEPPHAGSHSAGTQTPRRRGPLIAGIAAVALVAVVGGLSLGGVFQPPAAAVPSLTSSLGSWCVSQTGRDVDLDFNFAAPPPVATRFELLQRILTLPRDLPNDVDAPGLRSGNLHLADFTAPLAFSFAFERLDHVAVEINAASDDCHLQIALSHPAAASHRQLLIRLDLEHRSDAATIVAIRNGEEIAGARELRTRDGQTVSRLPRVGQPPLRLEVDFEAADGETQVLARVFRPQRPEPLFEVKRVIEGDDWVKGVPTLRCASTRGAYSLRISRVALRGRIGDTVVHQVP